MQQEVVLVQVETGDGGGLVSVHPHRQVDVT